MPTDYSSEFKARVTAWCPAQFRNKTFEVQLMRAFLCSSACAADQHRSLMGARPIRPLKSYPDPIEALGFAKIDYTGWPDWVSSLEVKEMTAQVFKALPEYSTSIPDSYRRPIAEGGRPWKRNLNAFGQFQPESEALWLYCEYRPHSNPTQLAIYTAQIKVL